MRAWVASVLWLLLSTCSGHIPAFAGVQPVQGPWPDTPLIDTSCHKIIRDLVPEAESTLWVYNSVAGTLRFVYQFGDGTTLETIWTVLDLAHEEAANYQIKLMPYPREFSVSFRGVTERWVDQVGKGECQDYVRR